MELTRKPSIESYSMTTSPNLATPWFPHLNRNRFQLLLKFLHFSDNFLPAQGRPILHKIQPLIDYYTHLFAHYFRPSKNISPDESMVGFKGKTPHLRQYTSNKHHARFRIKLWCLCDTASSYTHTLKYMKVKLICQLSITGM